MSPPPRTPPPEPELSEVLQSKSNKELADLEEDAHDSDDERVIRAFRQQRLAEMRKHQKASNFGEIKPIGRDDYASEVTEASKADEPDAEEKGLGTGVIVCLYQQRQVTR